MKKEYTLTELLSLRSKYKDQIKTRYENMGQTPSQNIYNLYSSGSTRTTPKSNDLLFSALRRGIVTEEEKTDITKGIQSRYDTIYSTIRNFQKVSAIIYKLNNQTMFNDKITLAEAVALNTEEVKFEKMCLINMLRIDAANLKKRYESEMNSVNDKASINAYLDTVLGTDRTDVSPEDVENYVKMYHKMNDYTIIDPLGIEELADQLQKDYDDLYTDIDVRMSIINATTKIEVDLDDDLM